ncbi:MAG: hypothetical protein H2212_14955 [Ruminococcus sp.]|nr:hypothetical protein [Ruminococcus sp.]
MELDLEREKRLTEVEQRTKSNTHRLDKLEPVIEEIHNMSATLVEMTTEMKYTNRNVEEIKEKVEVMEQEPARKWKDSTRAIFNAILGAIGTAIGAGILYLLSLAIK